MLEPGTERREPAVARAAPEAESREPLACDWCGSPRLAWVKCKLICHDCRQIVKSCADL